MSSHAPSCLPLLSLAVFIASSSTALANSDESVELTNVHTMQQVVVTATKTENTLTTAPASMSVITSEEIMSQPHTHLGDILKQAMGVEGVMRGSGGRELISIRGMDSGFTLLMINGRKLSSSNALVRGNDYDLSTIPLDNIERIEIIRGPMSSLYGSEALGGVINVITKLPDNEWRSSLSADYSRPTGTNHGGGEYRVGLNTGGALLEDELYLNLSISQNDRKAWTPSYDGQEVTSLEALDNLSLSSNLNWLVNEHHTLDMDATYNKDQRESQTMARSSLALTHSGDFDWGQTQLRYGAEEVRLDEKWSSRPSSDRIIETNQAIDGSLSTELQNHRVTTGGEVRYTTLDNPRDLQTSGNSSVNQQAVFFQDEWGLAQDWTLTFGTRMDHHENFGVHFSPRAYLVNTVTDKLTIKGGVGQAFKAPSMLQLTDEYRLSSCGGDCWVKGNPDLKPETSTSFELSANYQESNWHLGATVYRNDVKDLIERNFDDVLGTEEGRDLITYHNVARAQIQGVELEGQQILTETLSLKAELTFTDAKDKTTNELLAKRPRQTFKTQLEWQPTQPMSTFATVAYSGSQRLYNDTYRGGYTTMDLGVNYQFSNDLRARAGIRNITNKQHSDDINLDGYGIEPRTWYLGFTSNF